MEVNSLSHNSHSNLVAMEGENPGKEGVSLSLVVNQLNTLLAKTCFPKNFGL